MEAITDLYIKVKVRSADEVRLLTQIENFNSGILEEEKKELMESDPVEIIEKIKASIEILLNIKSEEESCTQTSILRLSEASNVIEVKKADEQSEAVGLNLSDCILSEGRVSDGVPPPPPESGSGEKKSLEGYEKMIVKYEADIRNHIRNEQQMKLYVETLQE